jgi:hypothetical protein
VVVDCSPRLDVRLEDALRSMRDLDRPVAAIWGELGTLAGALGLPRPSYGTVRVRVLDEREMRAERRAALLAALDTLADIELRAVPLLPDAVPSAYRSNLEWRRGARGRGSACDQ